MKHVNTIVQTNLFTQLQNGSLQVAAACVIAKTCTRSGSTYNSYVLQVKCDNGNVYNLAYGFMEYGYGRAYLDRAYKVLGLIDNKLRIDFDCEKYGKVSDMITSKHYIDDIKLGYFKDISDLV